MNKTFGMIFGMFVLIMVGVALFTSIIDSSSTLTNETLDIGAGFNATDFNTSMVFNLTNGDWVDNTVIIYNGSGTTNSTAYSVNYTTNGITFENSSWIWEINTISDNNSGVNYSYYHADYITDGSSRTLITLFGLFFVIALLAFVYAKLRRGSEDIFDR